MSSGIVFNSCMDMTGSNPSSGGCFLTFEAARSRRGRWREVMGGGEWSLSRLVVDVGCAEGGLVAEMAMRHPDAVFIGMDWKAQGLKATATQLAARSRSNAILVHGRAMDLGQVFSPGEVDGILLFHPEPCDAPKQAANRLMNPAFLRVAHEVIRPGGTFTLKTDHPGYYQWALGLFGLEQPEWFERARQAGSGGGRPGEPRVRVRDVVPPESVPSRHARLSELFTVTQRRDDYWADPLPGRVYSEQVSGYERKFRDKRLPIYLLELTRR